MASQETKNKHSAHPWGPPPRGRRRWVRWLFFGMVIITALIAVLPTIFVHTRFLGLTLSSALEPEQGRLTTGGASLGWFSHTMLHDVRVHGPDGELLFSAARVHVDRSLLALATDASDLGTVRVERPTIHLVTRRDGSNIEDFIAPWLAPKEKDRQHVTVRVEIVEGTIEVNEQPADATWRAEQLTAICTIAPSEGSSPAIALTVKTSIQPESGVAGRLEFSIEPSTEGGQKLKVLTDALPLVPFVTVLRRAGVQDTRFAGRLTLNTTTTWSQGETNANGANTPVLETTGRAIFTDLDVSSAAIGEDRVRLARIDMPWQLRFDGDRANIQQLEIQSDVGSVSVEGGILLSQWFAANNEDNNQGEQAGSDMPRWLAVFRQPLIAGGEIDIAKLAAMLPTTLQIRGGTTITSGNARFDLHSIRTDNGHRWSGELVTTDLAARDAESSWRWKQPVNLKFVIRDEDGWSLDAMRCDSDFLQISATGDARQLETRVECDLSQLAARLGQFIDMSNWQLAGQGEATVNVRSSEGKFQLTGNATVKSLRVAHDETVVLDEPQLQANVTANGSAFGTTPKTCDAATVHVLAGEDEINVSLVEPIEMTCMISSDSNENTSWVFDVSASGRLARWLTRLRPWFVLEGWEIDGDGSVAARVAARANTLHVDQSTFTIANFNATGPGWRIIDPKIELKLQNSVYTPAKQHVTIGESTITSTAIAARAQNINVTLSPDGEPKASGEIAFRTLLERLDGWRVSGAGMPPYWRYAGELIGRLSVVTQEGRTTADVNATVEHLALHEYVADGSQGPSGYRAAWQEPKVKIIATVVHDGPADRIRIKTAQLTSDTLAANIAGAIDGLSTTQTINMQGTLDYDLAKWTPIIRAHLGPKADIQLMGRDRATFEIAGIVRPTQTDGMQSNVRDAQAHWSRNVRGLFSAGWKGLDLYGLPVKSGRISARLDDGAVRFDPLNVAIGDGSLSATAQLRLDPEPQELIIPQGQLLQNVYVTPEVSDRFLKYIAPILNSATDSEGTFSLTLAGGRVPLGKPEKIDLTGQLVLKSARVMPGPMVRQIIQPIEQLLVQIGILQKSGQTAMTQLILDDNVIDFRIIDGRVHHRGLEFTSGDVVVRSSGSVGFDETLALILEIPIPDKWISKELSLRSLQGHTVRLTIHGTFSQPKIDHRALRDLTRNLTREAARGVIENQLGRMLEGLMKPRE